MALNAKTIAAGVGDILNVDGGLTGSGKQVVDGDGTASPIYISTAAVGIGASSPAQLLHIQNAGDANLLLEATGSNTTTITMKVGGATNFNRLSFQDNSGAVEGDITYTHGTDVLSFAGKGTQTEMARFDNSGNFGIGKTSPGNKLEVAGSVKLFQASDALDKGLIIENAAGSNSSYIYQDGTSLKLFTQASTGITILDSGNVSIPSGDLTLSAGDLYLAATKKLSFDGGDHTYIDEVSANKLRFHVGGSNVMYMDGANGRVGIGASDPVTNLEIRGAGSNIGGELALTMADTAVGAGETMGTIRFQAPKVSDGGDSIETAAYIKALSSGTFSSTRNDTVLTFATAYSEAATEKMRISPIGKVGIGETDPDYLLHLKTGDSNGLLKLENPDAGAEESYIMAISDDGGVAYGAAGTFSIRDSGNNVRLAIAKTTGNIGIGTTAPQSELHVKGTGGNILRLEATEATNTPYIEFFDNAARKGVIGYGGYGDGDSISIHNEENSDIRFGTNDTFAMIIDQSQKVGIGTSSPGALLNIRSTATSSASAGADLFLDCDDGAGMGVGHRLGAIKFRGAEDGSSSMIVGGQIECFANHPSSAWNSTENSAKLTFSTNNSDNSLTEKMVIMDIGNVGIGETDPDYLLHLKDGDSNGLLKFENPDAGGESYIMAISDDGGTAYGAAGTFSIRDSGNNVRLVIKKTSGNVGIGTSAPESELHVKGTGGDVLRLEATEADNAPYIAFYDNAARKGVIGYGGYGESNSISIVNEENSDILFYTNNTFAIKIDENQRVGIGTISPGNLLELAQSDASPVLELSCWDVNSASNAGEIRFQKSKHATIHTHEDTAAGERHGYITAYGVNTSHSSVQSAGIMFAGDAAPGGTYVPGKIEFLTAATDANPTTRMTIDDDGHIGIGATKRLYFDSTAATGHTYIDEESNDLLRISVGANEVMKLDANSRISLGNNDSGGDSSNTIFGYLAGDKIASGGVRNTLFGSEAGAQATYGITTGDDNTAVGAGAVGGSAAAHITGANNTGIGSRVMWDLQGDASNNTGLGMNALKFLTTGSDNTALGTGALEELVTGSRNTAVGTWALGDMQGGGTSYGSTDNVTLGYNAAGGTWADQNCSNLVVIGSGALAGALEGDGCDGTVAIGKSAGAAITSAQNSTIIGFQAGDENQVGDSNTVIGYNAWSNSGNFQSDDNVFVGSNSGNGSWVTAASSKNTAIGANSMKGAMNASHDNTAVGYNALLNIGAAAEQNTAVGSLALGVGAVTGNGNTALGYNTGYDIVAGHSNVMVGASAAANFTTNAQNVVIGNLAFDAADAGEDMNVVIGYNAGGAINHDDSHDNVIIGKDAGTGGAASLQNCVIIGESALNATGANAVDGEVAIGKDALGGMTTGRHNVAIGLSTMKAVLQGEKNVVIGHGAMDESGVSTFTDNTRASAISSGTEIIMDGANTNISVGQYVLDAGSSIPNRTYITAVAQTSDPATFTISQSITGAISGGTQITFYTDPRETVAIGYSSMGGDWITGGVIDNTAVGAFTLNGALAGANYNTAIGNRALSSGTNIWNNTMIGWHAGSQLTTGSENTAVGSNAMGSAVVTGDNNVAMGFNAGVAITDGQQNTLLGKDAGYSITGTDDCVFVGYMAGYDLNHDDAAGSVFIGKLAGANITSGVGNVAIGLEALTTENDGDFCTAIGHAALNLQTGNSGHVGNTAVGYFSGKNVTTAEHSTFMGKYSGSGGQSVHAALTGNHNTCIGSQSGEIMQGAAHSNTFVGSQTGIKITTGAQNILLGTSAGAALTTGTDNVALGYAALDAADGTEEDNIAIGTNAMGAVDENVNSGGGTNSANWNIAIGTGALIGGQFTDANDGNDKNLAGNVAIGHVALTNTGVNAHTGTIAIGYGAWNTLTSGNKNTGIGYQVGKELTTGASNTVVGYNAWSDSSSLASNYNTIIGAEACNGDWQGSNSSSNVTVGAESMQGDMNGANYNTGVGFRNLQALTQGDNNVSIGHNSSLTLTTGTGNIAIGVNVMRDLDAGANASGSGENVFIGNYCAQGAWADADASTNVAIGSYAFSGAVNGVDNCVAIGGQSLQGAMTTAALGSVAVGYQALQSLTSGAGNIGIGYEALQGHTTGSRNIAIGYGAMDETGGDVNDAPASIDNVLIGYNAGGGNWADDAPSNYNVGLGNYVLDGVLDAANNNTAMGHNALTAITEGDDNVGIGHSSGDTITTGDYNTFLGSGSDGAGSVSFQTAIGYNAVCSVLESVAIGTSITNSTQDTVMFGDTDDSVKSADWSSSGAIAWTGTSDRRKKRNIKDSNLGLEFINKLRPVTFQWKPQDEVPKEWQHYSETNNWDTEKIHHGFIAQEVKEVLDEFDAPNSVAGWNQDDDGMQRLGETKLITPLIKAVQELSAEVKSLKEELNNK